MIPERMLFIAGLMAALIAGCTNPADPLSNAPVHPNLVEWVNRLEHSTLTEKKTTAGLPDFIRTALDSLYEFPPFSLADPGAAWSAGCLAERSEDGLHELPRRQLVYFGMDTDIALMLYLAGGIGVSENMLLIRFEHDSIVDMRHCRVPETVSGKREAIQYLRTLTSLDAVLAGRNSL